MVCCAKVREKNPSWASKFLFSQQLDSIHLRFFFLRTTMELLEIKNLKPQIQSWLNGISKSLDTAKGRIYEVESKSKEVTVGIKKGIPGKKREGALMFSAFSPPPPLPFLLLSSPSPSFPFSLLLLLFPTLSPPSLPLCFSKAQCFSFFSSFWLFVWDGGLTL